MTIDRTNGPAPRQEWLALLRDAGPNGAAPGPREAAIWGAILDLREVRDTIENAVERMTAKLDHLADETTLTHAIVAGWEPEDEDTEQPESLQAGTPPAAEEGRTGPPDLDDLVQRARDGLTTLKTLWNAHAIVPGRYGEGAIAFATSIEFCLDGMEAVLDQIADATSACSPAGEGKAAPPA